MGITTTFLLESGYASVHGTKIKHIIECLKEITEIELRMKCEELGIGNLLIDDKHSPIEEYYKVLSKYSINEYKSERYVSFHAYGGYSHRHILEFVIKTICLMVLEKAIKKEYMISFRSW